MDPALAAIDHDVRVRARSMITPDWIDGIVLTHAGYGSVFGAVAERAAAAGRAAEKRVRSRLRARLGVRAHGGVLGYLSVSAGVLAFTPVAITFARRIRIAEHDVLFSMGAAGAAAMLVLIAILARGRPIAHSHALVGGAAAVAIAVTGWFAQSSGELAAGRREAVWAAMAASVLAALLFVAPRVLRSAAARAVDLALLEERRAVRAELAGTRAALARDLERGLAAAGADGERLGRLWSHARARAAARGVEGLERPPGPVGLAVIAALSDVPPDPNERRLERLEAARGADG
ncbi:hypothetical protein GCM10010921_16490 [Microbacterium album]|uniref:Uncharacterized protein n=1 Tax=Microbacterium album TaxID=2053191 RepID=A0A917IDV5_9MICO|nr:hypothetical protein GCM10010921_16490 [Microbacterium album]